MDRQQKLAFYFNWQAEAKAKWLNNVFENLNSGFVSFKDGSINNINSFLKNQVEKLNNKKIKNKSLVKDMNYYETTLNTKENKLFLFKTEFEHMIKPVLKILAQINTESISKKYSIKNFIFIFYSLADKFVSKVLSNFKHEISKIKTEDKLEKMKKFSTIINNLIKSFSKISSIENFIYIGDISYIIDENEIYYEVLCRHNFSDAEGSLEILFNDVTRVRQREKQNAEFKYKSLFLSKVAHEFKNPLICITELINQSCEILPRKAKRNQKIMSNLEQTKSLSNFMQILIKDLNYFSESQIGKTIEYTYKETDLFELLDFCDKIKNTLLLKSNKKEKIEFMIKRCENIPDKITTDESRLKQLLVNLLSNSVKFTLHGQIKLEICIENKCEENFSKRFLNFR